MSFHRTQSAIPGLIVNAGDVIRLFDGPFGDGVILGFNDISEARVARPYVYASSTGTTGPVGLTGVEYVTLTPANLAAVLDKWPRLQEGKFLK